MGVIRGLEEDARPDLMPGRCAILAFLSFVPFFASGQNENDILRYAGSELHGTARYVGMGGAFGALGADLSAINSNPAGIALFRKNEFAFTPSFNNTVSSSSFNGQEAQKEQFELAAEQIALSLIQKAKEKEEWESFHFALSYDRKRSFNDRTIIRGDDQSRSILDRFVRISNGTPLSLLPDQAPFTGELAYQAYLMDPVSGTDRYTHRLEDVPISMEKRLDRSGSMGEARFNFGADRSGGPYFGASLGVPVIDLQRMTTHIETVQGKSDIEVRDLRYEEDLSVDGYGMNLRLGMITRPNDRWRFGLSAKSPGLIFMKEEWSARMKADHGPNSTYDRGPSSGAHRYRIRTPYRVSGSMAFFYEKHGVLSLEYHFTDPRSGKLLPKMADENAYAYGRENRRLDQRASPTHELRAGLEWRLAPLYLRGGYGLLTAPVRTLGNRSTGAGKRFSVGAGFRQKGIFFDIAYRQEIQNEVRRPADPLVGNAARTQHRMQGIVLTGGSRF